MLIGFVDSGLDLRHPEFLADDGSSRIVGLWDMTAQGTPPRGFLHGAAYTKAEIATGLVDSPDETGHGTAVAAIAAGRSGAAPGASIAAVKLSSSRTTDIMRAVKYLLDQAEERRMPCVVNLSYGTNCGSHQGQSLFESYIDQSSQRGRTVIVCAAGNEGSGAHPPAPVHAPQTAVMDICIFHAQEKMNNDAQGLAGFPVPGIAYTVKTLVSVGR